MLTKKHCEDVCLCIGGQIDANTCRYLAVDEDVNNTTYHCYKKNAQKKAEVDGAVDRHLTKCKNTNIDPYSHEAPIGNHCAGFPILKHIPQGYDVP